MTPQEGILKECAEAKQTLTESLINRIWRNNSTLIYSGSTEARIILEALEKQIPQKPYKHEENYYVCPKCDCSVYRLDVAKLCNITYCWHCGQAIDWSDTDE